MREVFTATYLIEPQKENIDRAVELLLAEMTSGIQYTALRDGVAMDQVEKHVPFVDPSVRGEVRSLQAQADGDYRVTFAFPSTNLDAAVGGITNLWGMVSGEVFNFYFVKHARLVELDLPGSFTSYYLGPRFGIAGLRRRLGLPQRPIFGAIVKPNLGLDAARTAELVRSLHTAGFSFIKDDEISVNPALCPMHLRVRSVAAAIARGRERLGRGMLYMANVTSDFSQLERAAQTAAEEGAGGLMIDPFCTGLSAIDFLRRHFELPIYCHRVGYGLHCRGDRYSVSYAIFSRLFRLLGADFSHVGGIWGGSDGRETKKYLDILRRPDSHRRTWPVVSGISCENMAEYYRFYGDDTLFLDHIDIYSGERAAAEKLHRLHGLLSVEAEP